MNTDNFQELHDKMYNSLLDCSSDQEKSRLQKTLRAIRFTINYLFSYIQFQGSSQLEYDTNGGMSDNLNEDEKIQFKILLDELDSKANILKDDITSLVILTYLKIEESTEISDDELDNYLKEVKFKVQTMTHLYLEYVKHTPNSINERAPFILSFLSGIAYANQINNTRKFEMRHNYGGATTFIKQFFI